MAVKHTAKTFILTIEELVKTKRLTYMEAVVYYCEMNQLEPASITKWIDRSLKEKLQADAENLNYLPKSSKLPL